MYAAFELGRVTQRSIDRQAGPAAPAVRHATAPVSIDQPQVELPEPTPGAPEPSEEAALDAAEPPPDRAAPTR